MGRWSKLALLFSAVIPTASAQITNGGYGYGYGTASIPELFGQIFGISVSDPYQLLGILATFSVMWVSTYVIFKIALQYLDENLEDSNMNKPFQDAVGLTDDDSTNVLALLTLLITLTVVGSAGFAGLINGWQAMILLAFTFMILAGTIFVIIGGVGGTVAGSTYLTGASINATAKGIEETKQALDRVGAEEEQIEEEEEREEEEIDEGEDEQADEEANVTAQELEEVIQILSDAEDELNELMDEEIDELEDDIEKIRRIINLLGENDG